MLILSTASTRYLFHRKISKQKRYPVLRVVLVSMGEMRMGHLSGGGGGSDNAV